MLLYMKDYMFKKKEYVTNRLKINSQCILKPYNIS